MFTYTEKVTPIAALRPAAAISSNGDVNGITIQQSLLSEKYEEVVFAFQTGAATGSPSAVAVVGRVQQSDDGSTWTDVTDAALVEAATKSIAAVNTMQTIAARLSGLKDYVRLVQAVTLTGGISPTLFISAVAMLGRPRRA